MIERDISSKLTNWLNEADRKPLLIRGARQVGKSWVVTQWAQENSLDLITINFEEQPKFIQVFETDYNIDRIIDELATLTGRSLRKSNSIVFLDEIQKAPKAITALRYFYEKSPQVKVLAAGSLVEFVLEECGLPVGRVKSLFMFPLTFSEFLKALGKVGLAEFLNKFTLDSVTNFPEIIHQEILSFLKLYFKLGGMPKVVSTYIKTNDITKASEEQALILQGYKDDFRKYAKKTDWVLLESIFTKMGQIAGGSHIKFSKIDPELKSLQIRRALTALEHALIIHKISPTHCKKLPLSAHAEEKRFKITFLDIGLLHHLLGFDWKQISLDSDLTNIADGRFAEQFVAQEIIATKSNISRYALHYWSREQAGAESEVDFVIELNNKPVPIEVKSGVKGKLRSLAYYIKELAPEITLVLSQRNVQKLDNMYFLPMYLVGKI